MFSTAVTSNQIVAFILAMFLCWFFYDGLELIGSFSIIGDMDFIFKYVGLTSHYVSIRKGLIDTSDLVYFIGMIAIFLTASLAVIKSLKR
jgi:ABC-2 type transport system permease protein